MLKILEGIGTGVVLIILAIAIIGSAIALVALTPIWFFAERERKIKSWYWKDRFKGWTK